MEYTHEFINELIFQLPEEIKVKYDRLEHVVPYTDTICELLKQFEKYSLDDYRKSLKDCQHTYSHKKIRWLKKLHEQAQSDLSRSSNPFHDIWELSQNINNWKMVFGNRTLEEIVSEKIDECEIWKNQTGSLFIQYPYFNTISRKRALSAVKNDLLYSILIIFRDKYEFKPQKFYRQYPQTFIDKPMWQPDKAKKRKAAEKDVHDEIILQDGKIKFVTDYTVTGQEVRVYKPMDSMDNEIFQIVLNEAVTKVAFAADGRVAISLLDLAKQLYPNQKRKISKSTMNALANRVLSLQSVRYRYIDGSVRENSMQFGLFELISIKDDICIFSFSSVIQDAVLNNQLLNVKTRDMQALENSIAKLLCFSLHNERIKLYMKNEGMTGYYGYEMFLMNVKFPTRKKQKNMELIREALQEFQNKKIIIKNFDMLNSGFKIEMYPLTDLEMEDVKNLIIL